MNWNPRIRPRDKKWRIFFAWQRVMLADGKWHWLTFLVRVYENDSWPKGWKYRTPNVSDRARMKAWQRKWRATEGWIGGVGSRLRRIVRKL